MQKQSLLFIILSFILFTHARGQADLGLPTSVGMGGVANGTAKDWECIGMNPANLGWKENHKFSISAGILGISIYSKALNYEQLNKAIFHRSDSISSTDKKDFAQLFAGTTGLSMQSNITWITSSVALPKVGGFAFNLRDRSFGHITLNKNAADILFLGKNAPVFQNPVTYVSNVSKIFDSTSVGFTHYRELNIAYGKKLFGFGGTSELRLFDIYGGIGFKYIWGLADFETSANNGVLTGRGAFPSSTQFNLDSIAGFQLESTPGLFPAVGHGTAWDFGIGVGIKKVKITFSATDIGQINWDKNIIVANDSLIPDTSNFSYQGLQSFDPSKASDIIFGKDGLINFKPGNAYSSALPAKFRTGIGIHFTKKFAIGADMILPLNNNIKNLDGAYFALGAHTELARNFAINLGIAGNSTYGFSLPFGVVLSRFFKVLEVSLATNNILTYIAPGNNPNLSFAMAIFRFDLDPKPL